jgi:hypothetical protein
VAGLDAFKRRALEGQGPPTQQDNDFLRFGVISVLPMDTSQIGKNSI